MPRISVNQPRVRYSIDKALPRIIVHLPRIDAEDRNHLAPRRALAIVS